MQGNASVLVERPATEFPLYQSHDGVIGMSDSRKKWERLKIPETLNGMHVLDVGCNEGLLTSWCATRGAEKVVGIDFDRARVEFATQQYGSESIKFLHQKWDHLPEGTFDLVLWTSAMHYEKDPKSVLEQIRARLRQPSGLLILECGYISRPGREMVAVSRHSDERLYPTSEYLLDVLLQNFTVRQIAGDEIVPGDPVPRGVFHCRRRLSTVTFVTGPTETGKSDLVDRHLHCSASKVLRIDVLVSRIATSSHVHGELQRAIKENYSPTNLGPIYALLQQTPLLEQFVDWLGQFCTISDDLVVIEGDLARSTIDSFARRNPHLRVWTVGRVS